VCLAYTFTRAFQ